MDKLIMDNLPIQKKVKKKVKKTITKKIKKIDEINNNGKTIQKKKKKKKVKTKKKIVDGNDDSNLLNSTEVTLCSVSVTVYRLPKSYGKGGNFVSQWDRHNPLWKGKLRIRTQGEDDLVVLLVGTDQRGNPKLFATGELIPMKKIVMKDIKLDTFVEDCSDSSRYFVIKIINMATKRRMPVGIGFADRSQSQDFKGVFNSRRKYLIRHYKIQTEDKLYDKMYVNVDDDDDKDNDENDEVEDKESKYALKGNEKINVDFSKFLGKNNTNKKKIDNSFSLMDGPDEDDSESEDDFTTDFTSSNVNDDDGFTSSNAKDDDFNAGDFQVDFANDADFTNDLEEDNGLLNDGW